MDIKTISSLKNDIIKDTTAYRNSASLRKEKHMFLAEGARLCGDAVLSNTEIIRLFYTEKAYKKYHKYIDGAKVKNNEIYLIKEHVASALSDTKTTQGVFALCKMRDETEIKTDKVLCLENVSDPSNMGTIFRTAEAMGITDFILAGTCCDPYSPKVTRGSMGAVFRINIISYSDISLMVEKMQGDGYTLYASVVNDSAKKVNQIEFDKKSVMLVGNEGDGLTKEIVNLCDERVTIPMNGRAESLNASVAASILMWEMVK